MNRHDFLVLYFCVVNLSYLFWSKFFAGEIFASIFICCNLHSWIAGKIAKIRTCKNFKQHSMCFTFILILKLKPSYLAAPSVLSVSFLDFSARESLMSFNSWLSLSTSSSPMPPSPDSPLALSKDCSDKNEALYLSVIVFNGHFIRWYCYFTRSSVRPDSLAACSTSAEEEKFIHFSVILRPRVLVRPGNLSCDLPLVLYLLSSSCFS